MTRPWTFISENGDSKALEHLSKLEIVDVERRVEGEKITGLSQIMDIVQQLSGVILGPEKRHLAETRLMRRVRALKLRTFEDYLGYFSQHREVEIEHAVSLLTTHTTEFFREPDHFDFLADRIFPDLLRRGSSTIRIWSAASSTGEELYSLAIAYFEFLAENGLNPSSAPKLECFGTDIDFHSVEVSREGIYPATSVRRLHASIVKKYFDFGTGDIAQFVRLNAEIHRRCSFMQMNLLAERYLHKDIDVIFLRNVMIYLKVDNIKRIATRMEGCLAGGGCLFLGHSESISNLGLTCYQRIGNSIYQTNRRGLDSGAKVETQESLVRVLIVDDSASIRKMLARVFSKEQGFEVVGEAESPIVARRMAVTLNFDVMTLDIHMPGENGIAYLQSIAGRRHPPVVMISTVNSEHSAEALKCLELGAIDYIEKPNSGTIHADGERIREVVRAASKLSAWSKKDSKSLEAPLLSYRPEERDLILIGASTGGVEAIKSILQQMPENTPPILIVQHIPAGFSRAFAKRLNECCPMKVSEARDGEEIEANHAYIAPGSTQMGVIEGKNAMRIIINDDPAVNRHKPSVDYLFASVAKHAKARRISAALLTGMGRDGAAGLKLIKALGAHTIAQDQASSIVYGMPKAAADIGAANEIVSLDNVSRHLLLGLHRRR